jgi:hypothetical protein
MEANMGLEDFTRHQQGIIKRYYANKDQIQLQRLSELVTDLYLAEGKKREKVWKSITTVLEKMEIPQARIDHLVKQNDPKLIAQLVTELQE